MITVFFVDEGQDFLEWDIDDEGRVVDCRPYQGDIWIETKVLNEKIMPGDLLDVTTPDGVERTIAHAVKKVQQKRRERPYEAILSAIKQDLQSLLESDSVDFVAVRKLADIATEIEASSVTMVSEVGEMGTSPMRVRPVAVQAYGPPSTERMLSEILPQFVPLIQGKFASDSVSSLASLLKTYTQVRDPDAPGYDEELATAVKDRLKQLLKEEDHENIHTDTPG